MRVLTFNLHSQYLYLLSFTGWEIENLIVPPERADVWHTMPYGYPTFPGAVNRLQGHEFGALFPADINQLPPVAMAPPVDNIFNVMEASGHYDLVVYIERNTLIFYDGPAARRAFVNLAGDGFSIGRAYGDTVVHSHKAPNGTFIHMGIPDNGPPRQDDIAAVFTSFAAARTRPHMINLDMIAAVAAAVPHHLHDMALEQWDYEQLHEAMSRYSVYLSPAIVPGGPVLATIEAFMAGMPVVLSEPYGHFREISDEGCLRVSSIEEAVEACQRLLADPKLRRRIGSRGQEEARQVFSINRFLDGWRRLAESS